MGVKQSKRSVDITETSTKGEIEGFGNEGKVEKIIDGVVEKVSANGHVDGDLQNGIEPLQNGVELIQNGEAATVATEISEQKDVDQSLPVEGVVNGQVENGEVNGEVEKPEEGKKSKEKLDKKGKKEKLFKKKFSLRSLSFSKKDKSKPLKDEKSTEKVDETETETEEALTSPEKECNTASQEQLIDSVKSEETTTPVSPTAISNEITTVSPVKGEVEMATPEKLAEAVTKTADDLPPPLPASPPPSEPVEGKLATEMNKLEMAESASGNSSSETGEATPSLANVLAEKTETTMEVITNADEIAMETGKQIEEKATNLLKTVEERAEESMKAVGESITQNATELKEVNALEGQVTEKTKEAQETSVEEKTLVDTVTAIPVEISNVGTLSPKGEEPIDKHEEGAGECLADIPKDLTDEVTAATIEVSNPDSLEISATIPPPPPVVEAVTGE